MKDYRTIAARAEAGFVEKKSEFTGYICPVENEQQAIDFVQEIRAMHRKATHNCYAYILRENNTARHSDDGEPGGTAGVPIHDVLCKAGLVDVACVVTRYFGGIMLGAGGLVRAYSRGAAEAVAAARVRDMRVANMLRVTVAYPLYGRIGALLAKYDVRKTAEEFSDVVGLEMFLRAGDTEGFSAEMIDLCHGDVVVENIQLCYHDFG